MTSGPRSVPQLPPAHNRWLQRLHQRLRQQWGSKLVLKPILLGALLAAFGVGLGLRSTLTPPRPLAQAAAYDQSVASAAGARGGAVSAAPRIQLTATPLAVDVIAAASALEAVYQNLYDRTSVSVVNIEARRPDVRIGQETGGSGFVLDRDGHLLTNAHVVQNATQIFVTFNDGVVTAATVVGVDEFSDLAVLKVEASAQRLIPVTLGDSNGLRVGQLIVTIGNPFGLLSSMTTGIISATGRALDSSMMLNPNNTERFSNPSIIQIDAQINPGNSGGPLLDLNGTVIGINTAIRTETGNFQGIGFAVPVNTIKRIVPQLIATGSAAYSWLGINANDRFSVAAVATELNLPVDYGILVSGVTAGSPAETAGLRGGTERKTIRGQDLIVGGDLIIAINGAKLRDMDSLLGYLVANTSPGDVITLTVIRANATFDLSVTLQARPKR